MASAVRAPCSALAAHAARAARIEPGAVRRAARAVRAVRRAARAACAELRAVLRATPATRAACAACVLLGATSGSAFAQADAGSFLLRLRSLHVDPGIDDGIGLYITLEPRRFEEIDLTWFPRPEWGIELSATFGRTHSVKSAGFEVARLRQLPPTLVLQYHFTGWRVQPYVQAGISYTLISNLRFAPDLQATLQPTLRNRSVGPVWGVGVEVPLARGFSLNVDWKQLKLKTDIEALGAGVGYFRVEPRLTSIGIGYRF